MNFSHFLVRLPVNIEEEENMSEFGKELIERMQQAAAHAGGRSLAASISCA